MNTKATDDLLELDRQYRISIVQDKRRASDIMTKIEDGCQITDEEEQHLIYNVDDKLIMRMLLILERRL